jgi:hydrogenase maturation protease
MTSVLVAGAGNIFRGDDGFGVEVARRLAEAPLPPGVSVQDYGIRALHLAYALLEPPDLLIVADAVSRGEAPGTLYLIEPDALGDTGALADPHGMSLTTVFDGVRALGGTLPRVLIVGCEPAELGETMGLSGPVEAAIAPAVRMIREVLARELSATTSGRRSEHEEHPETP